MSPVEGVPVQYRDAAMTSRIGLIAESFERLLARPLIPPADDMVTALWEAPFAVVAHGIEADPVFFFGNRYALAAFESDVAGFTQLPSRLSAEAPLREERQALLDRVTRDGFIDDYAGVRISALGKRFRIAGAIVWNLVDGKGERCGQAATFAL
jgi:hypothetical protein